ncbi:MAG TPA: DUF4266 domain-containing protein [Thermoanaerobaculia bacterium]|nr:DUF4266 domain-containing protein [Thermoanaerobaculia bacterium]
MTRYLWRFIATAALLLVAGCATVQPWDRDLLAEKKMSLNPSPMLQAVDEHIYFSKEASMGGMDAGGGGCGCN